MSAVATVREGRPDARSKRRLLRRDTSCLQAIPPLEFVIEVKRIVRSDHLRRSIVISR